ncbi:DeoR/GlpR family DNA-binding transcription regulator [Bacillus sp. FJAT-45037]|uniref:DeoR/GlpR family DNA-binding transcription regulator n=1 Tax=Bacillus sp. FJAT-45037 TaxID=2011007 RepID=UPI000C23081E|nr:DeoR/GlpR family DNA-binding transcription regulator [Bacillus sp. FJAT-45037]
MLTFERQQLILRVLEKKKVITISELVEETSASESTIRRDLTELENKKQLKRVHGGASLLSGKMDEPTVAEKESKHQDEKAAIGEYAASLVADGDCIFIDAGTTTKEMVQHLTGKDIVVVTNGINIVSELVDHGLKTYVTGGFVKEGTRALIGRGASDSLKNYRFDKAFIGANSIEESNGYSTPDPEEAFVKQTAIERANIAFVLADHSKFGDVSFAKIADLKETTIITSEKMESSIQDFYLRKTNLKVVNIK